MQKHRTKPARKAAKFRTKTPKTDAKVQKPTKAGPKVSEKPTNTLQSIIFRCAKIVEQITD